MPELTDQQVVESLVPSSRERNLQAGVTSCLWSNGRHFFQLLEGPQAAVIQTLIRIAGDGRHHGVRIVSSEPAIELIFRNEPLKLVLPEATPAGEIDRMLAELIESVIDGGLMASVVVTPENAEAQVLSPTSITTARREPVPQVQRSPRSASDVTQSAEGRRAGGEHGGAVLPIRTPLMVNVLTRLTCAKGV